MKLVEVDPLPSRPATRRFEAGRRVRASRRASSRRRRATRRASSSTACSCPYLLDAIRAYEEGVGSISEIDEAMKAGAGHPMGPLTLADFVGLDTLGSICDVMFDEFRERRFAQPPTLRKMLSAGWYGRKSGMGFYDYSGETPVENPGV